MGVVAMGVVDMGVVDMGVVLGESSAYVLLEKLFDVCDLSGVT